MVMDGHTKSQEEKYSLSGFFKKKKKKNQLSAPPASAKMKLCA